MAVTLSAVLSGRDSVSLPCKASEPPSFAKENQHL
jgi:hypothetical protein